MVRVHLALQEALVDPWSEEPRSHMPQMSSICVPQLLKLKLPQLREPAAPIETLYAKLSEAKWINIKKKKKILPGLKLQA